MSSSSEGAVVENAARSAREFGYTRADFERVRQLIRARAGISLASSKVDMVYSRLSRRLRELSIGSIREYLDRLEDGDADNPEWTEFTNALTTNLTAFFRESHHFDVLARYLAQVRPGKPVRIWCAAASTGEEPYSIAMTVAEHYDSLMPPCAILATDLDTHVLAHGQAGIYSEERVEKLSKARLRRFFQRGSGANAGKVRVVDGLRKMIQFRQLNLLAPSYGLKGGLDIIFCRNVMIYFDKPTQYGILEKMVPLLNDDGLFFAGHSESFLHAANLLAPCGRTVYRPVRAAAK